MVRAGGGESKTGVSACQDRRCGKSDASNRFCGPIRVKGILRDSGAGIVERPGRGQTGTSGARAVDGALAAGRRQHLQARTPPLH